MNLPKEMANRGLVVSCSQARRCIAMGAVQLNGEVVTELDTQATREDTIRLGNKTISYGSASQLAMAAASKAAERKSLGDSTSSASARENDNRKISELDRSLTGTEVGVKALRVRVPCLPLYKFWSKS